MSEGVLSEFGVQTLIQRVRLELTGQDWFWIVFVAVIASVATFGGFVLFLPAYVVALVVGYFATTKWRAAFGRERRTLFVLKVLAVVLPVFLLLGAVEIWLLPSVYQPGLSF